MLINGLRLGVEIFTTEIVFQKGNRSRFVVGGCSVQRFESKKYLFYYGCNNKHKNL